MKETVYGEGLNFNIPWVERPIIFDIRTRPVNLQTLTGSDLQMVTIAIRVLRKAEFNNLVWIYRYLGCQLQNERVRKHHEQSVQSRCRQLTMPMNCSTKA
jgi:regulator of protease activity HflC (stomatin/prohibitin superfamily)